MCSHITLAPVSVKLPASDTRLSPGAIPCWSHLQELIEDERVHLAAEVPVSLVWKTNFHVVELNDYPGASDGGAQARPSCFFA
jgi:hypothetical protein